MRAIEARAVLFGVACSVLLLASCSIYDSSLLAHNENALGGNGAGGDAQSAGTDAGGSGASAGAMGGAGAGSGGTTAGDGGLAGKAGMPEEPGQGGEGGQGCQGGDCCPDDPDKTEPGVCGCGVAEAPCLALKNALLHRYSFSGTGTVVTDSRGTAHGTVKGKGAALSGKGTLVLAGGVLPLANDPGQYVQLPPNCLIGLSNATFEAWVTWNGGSDSSTYQSYWQRVFDFGSTSTLSTGAYLLLTPRAANPTGPSRVTFSGGMGQMSESPVVSGGQLSAGSFHFTVVVDKTNSLISLYTNGTLSAAGPFSGSLADINASNCWLGRSQYAIDPYFAGTFDEFRVYSSALSPADIAFSQAMGPNPAFL